MNLLQFHNPIACQPIRIVVLGLTIPNNNAVAEIANMSTTHPMCGDYLSQRGRKEGKRSKAMKDERIENKVEFDTVAEPEKKALSQRKGW